MPDADAVAEAVKNLTPAELVRFRRWFAEFDAAAWDAQLEADANSGKLDRLAREARDDWEARR